jgi:hypothetical protein
MKIWNATFRSMSNPAYHHYGLKLWAEIVGRFDEVEVLAKEQIENSTNDENTAYLEQAFTLLRYVPPQFRRGLMRTPT